jgi:nitrate reductase NapD
MTSPGTNICGVLVHAMPDKADAVADGLSRLEGIEVHQRADGGRIIITAEDTAATTAADALLAVNRLDGVVATALDYHHCEPADLAEVRD